MTQVGVDIYAAQLPTIPLLCEIVFVAHHNRQSRQGGFVDRAYQKRSMNWIYS